MKDYSNVIYDEAKKQIKTFRSKGSSYAEIKDLSCFVAGGDVDVAFGILKKFLSSYPEDFSLEDWVNIVDLIEKGPAKPAGLFEGATNGFEIPTDPASQWMQYKNHLKDKGFTEDSIEELELSSKLVVERLSENTMGKETIKGLVVGNVQSGKTANMVGVMSMAADFGFNFFIVFSGMIDSLREQTQERMYEDLNRNGRFDWKNLINPSLTNSDPGLDWGRINLDSKYKYFTVGIKNKNRMESLVKWLYSDQNKLKNLKVLVIDDEADQASINTKDINKDVRTTINRLLLDLADSEDSKKLLAINYISYTATPFANVLNETRGLFPKDFIFALKPASDYIGPKQMFGLQDPESTAKIPIIQSFSSNEIDQVEAIHSGETRDLPLKFKESIIWFILAATMYRLFGIKDPVSMLIHTSFKVDFHNAIYQAVNEYLLFIKNHREDFFEVAEAVYDKITTQFTLQDFLAGMPNYSRKDKIPDYPDFKVIKRQLNLLFNSSGNEYLTNIPIDEDGQAKYHEGFHLVVDNSKSNSEDPDQKMGLIYPKKKETNLAPMFIVIGGNTLSRGLTLKGLVSSYFVRNTKQADTLLQMGRWFGFRKGYELLPRVWMDGTTRERFQYISQINEELIEEIETMSSLGQKPGELGVRVKNSPDNVLLRLTSPNKLQSAEGVSLDFSGINKQTTILQDNPNILNENLELTQEFLNKLGRPQLFKNKFIWKNVESSFIEDYLLNMQFPSVATFFNNMPLLVEWLRKIKDDDKIRLANFNVALVSKSDTQNNEAVFYLDDHPVFPITRSKKFDVNSKDKIISIGALSSGADYLADIPKHISVKNIKEEILKERAKYGFATVPLLNIYIIDKDSKAQVGNPDREDLNFSQNIVGLRIFIPGNSKNRNMEKYLSAKPNYESHEEYENYND
ncbi:Z1 domain-containing protein [Ignavigranum ruoffiae]